MSGDLVTPAVSCGLLAGTLRGELLDRGRIKEAVISLDDLRDVGQMWLINSVRGWWKATLVGDAP